jgi:hypothetical protein
LRCGCELNGIELAVRRAELEASRDAVARDVIALWHVTGFDATDVGRVTDRLVIGRQRGVIHETVSLWSLPSSQRISIEYAAQDISATRRPRASLPFVAPTGTQILQTVEFLDDRRGAREFVDASAPHADDRRAVDRCSATRLWLVDLARRTIADRDGERAAMLFAERAASEQAELMRARAEGDGVRVVLRVGGRAH